MPQDANKRKAAKKKNKAKANKKSSSSNSRGPRHHQVFKTEKKENNLSGNESSTTDITDNNVNEPQAETDSDTCLNPHKPNENNPTSVADYLAQPVDDSLVEQQTDLVVNENDLEYNQRLKENEVQKDYTITENSLLSDSSNVKCPYCGKRDDDGLKEPKSPIQCPEKQPLLDPTARETEKTSWKSCCGIFELCSGSSR